MNAIEQKYFSYYIKLIENHSLFMKGMNQLRHSVECMLFSQTKPCVNDIDRAWYELMEAFNQNQEEMEKALEVIIASEGSFIPALREATEKFDLKNNKPLLDKIFEFYAFFKDDETKLLSLISERCQILKDEEILSAQDYLVGAFNKRLGQNFGYVIVDKIPEGTKTNSPEFAQWKSLVKEGSLISKNSQVKQSSLGLMNTDGKIVIPIEIKTEPVLESENKKASSLRKDKE